MRLHLPHVFVVLAQLAAASATLGCDDDPAPAGEVDDVAGADATVSETGGQDADDVPPVVTPPLPRLVTSAPPDGAVNVPTTAWLRLDFEVEPAADALAGLALDCGEGTPTRAVESLGGGVVLVNPAGELPAEARCTLAWTGPSGAESIAFGVAADGAPAIVPYDREDESQLAPFPDDVFLAPDASTPTGLRLAIPTPDRPGNVVALFEPLVGVLPESLDGFSALAPIVLAVPEALDPGSIPLTEAASLDPFAALGLFDLDPASPTYLQRVAFDLVMKDEPNADGTAAHVLIVFPVAPLAARGRYAFVVTRRALVDPTRPLGPSAYTSRALADVDHPSGAAAAALAGAHPALLPDDLALVLRVTVRSLDRVGDDLIALREQTLAQPAPAYTITKVTPEEDADSPIAAVLEGEWYAPDFRDGDFLARDAAGRPRLLGTRPIPFVLALPRSAETAPAPLVMYQHGNPGSAEREVPSQGRRGLGAAGFAVAGFTDIVNRELGGASGDVSAYIDIVIQDILVARRVPDILATLDAAAQLSFIQLLGSMHDLDVLPLDAPDGQPDLDTGAPLAYLGVSFGSHRGTGLLPFAPEIKAATLLVGGGRIATSIVQQESDGPTPNHLYELVTQLSRDLTRVELWVGVALVQAAADEQDWLTHAGRLYDDPYPLDRPERASVLLIEGLADGLVPEPSTRAAATAMGLTQLQPSPEPVPTLAQGAPGPLGANIDARTTGGFLQYVPKGYGALTPSPTCEGQAEGHYCAQSASRQVYVRFFESALGGVPTITP